MSSQKRQRDNDEEGEVLSPDLPNLLNERDVAEPLTKRPHIPSKPEDERFPLDRLPVELQCLIMSELDIRSKFQLSACSKTLNRLLAESSSVWKHFDLTLNSCWKERFKLLDEIEQKVRATTSRNDGNGNESPVSIGPDSSPPNDIDTEIDSTAKWYRCLLPLDISLQPTIKTKNLGRILDRIKPSALRHVQCLILDGTYIDKNGLILLLDKMPSLEKISLRFCSKISIANLCELLVPSSSQEESLYFPRLNSLQLERMEFNTCRQDYAGTMAEFKILSQWATRHGIVLDQYMVRYICLLSHYFYFLSATNAMPK